MLDHPVCNKGIFNASEAQLYSMLLGTMGAVFVALACLEGEVIVGGAHSKAWPEPDTLVFAQKKNCACARYRVSSDVAHLLANSLPDLARTSAFAEVYTKTLAKGSRLTLEVWRLESVGPALLARPQPFAACLRSSAACSQ